ncbi:MAG: C39 family peptidase [Akkermansiaceae bacterium]|nr:C39 family peptidase [Akkermansiaceae bacterium]
MFARLLCLLLLSASPLMANAIPCSLDPLIKAPSCWEMTPAEFEKQFSQGSNKLYRWLTADKTRAKLVPNLYSNANIELTAFEGAVPVQEAIVDFADGKLNLISISFYNRGDNGPISKEVFKERYMTIGKALGQSIGIKPRERRAKPTDGLLTEGYLWNSTKVATALLEHNEGALDDGEREFLRLRMARPRASGMLAKSLTHSRGGAAIRLSELPRNVEKNDKGDVYVSGLPMVDQGNKGYCVAASVQRLFEYYGIGADMHQIAEIAGSDPKRGTSTLAMAKELDQIDYRFKTRLDILAMGKPLTEVEVKRDQYLVGDPYEERDFIKDVKRAIDEGLPLLWSLELGRYPEKPNLNPQTAGGHMRMIIGYNEKTGELLFSDSWGAGHELKRMNMQHAYHASHGLFLLKPTVH